MDNDKIGRFILKKRQEKGLTQNELGEKLFVTGKAVSKWERGLSLPDISILEKLAEVLDTDIYEILQIKKKENIDLKKIVEDERLRIQSTYRKKLLKLITTSFLLFLVILFKFIPFGYSIDHIRYTHYDNKLINLARPKFSFNMKNKENSFSYKNFRGKHSLLSEVKNYLNTLEHISCNDTTYYYDMATDITVIDYSVKSNLIYSSISYNIRNGNYCDLLMLEEYSDKLGGLSRYHTLYAEDSNLYINFLLNVEKKDSQYTFPAYMHIYYCESGTEKCKTLEQSTGSYEVINDELTYYREAIEIKSDDIEIPTMSNFVVRNQKLMIKENYLSDYTGNFILK